MEQNNSSQESENRSGQGTSEWLKFIVFFGAIILITALVIRVIGPIIFTQYVPPIVGITETADDNEAMVEDDQDSQEEAADSSESADSDADEVDSEPAAESESSEEPAESDSDSNMEDAGESEPDPLETEEETSDEVEEAASDAQNEPSDSDEPNDESDYMTYIVLPGDTLTSIAEAHDMTVDDIIAANELLNPNLVPAGQEIRIPK